MLASLRAWRLVIDTSTRVGCSLRESIERAFGGETIAHRA